MYLILFLIFFCAICLVGLLISLKKSGKKCKEIADILSDEIEKKSGKDLDDVVFSSYVNFFGTPSLFVYVRIMLSAIENEYHIVENFIKKHKNEFKLKENVFDEIPDSNYIQIKIKAETAEKYNFADIKNRVGYYFWKIPEAKIICYHIYEIKNPYVSYYTITDENKHIYKLNKSLPEIELSLNNNGYKLLRETKDELIYIKC